MACILPVELELYIFELSARESSKMAFALMCLSSYVHSYISPLLYEVMTVYVSINIREPSEEAIKKYGRHIRHLLLGWEVRQVSEMVPIYLHACPNIINLGIWGDADVEQDWLDLIKQLPLIRLSIDPDNLGMERWSESSDDFESVQKLLSSFTQLTHLDLARELPVQYIPCLAAIPKLTYLSMYCEQESPWSFPDLSQVCPNLKAFIMANEDSEVTEYREGDEDLEGVKDPRAVSCIVPDYVVDWERGARGQVDFYDFGLERLNARVVRYGRG